LWLLGWSACAPSRYVRPLERGEVAVTGHLGGPLFNNFDAPIPVPLTSVAVGYGLREETTVYGGLHLTALAFANLQLDAGVTHAFVRPQKWRPGVSVSPSLNMVLGFREGDVRVWPVVDANAWWEYGPRASQVYVGGQSWIELAGTRAHGADAPQRLLPGIQAGHVYQRDRWAFTTELKWSNAAAVNTDGTVDWSGLGSRGAVGIFLGITKSWGK